MTKNALDLIDGRNHVRDRSLLLMLLALALLCSTSTVPLPTWEQWRQKSTGSHAVGKLALEGAVLGASPGGGLVGAATVADLAQGGRHPPWQVIAVRRRPTATGRSIGDRGSKLRGYTEQSRDFPRRHFTSFLRSRFKSWRPATGARRINISSTLPSRIS